MKYATLFFSALSAIWMACLYVYTHGIKDIPAYEFQGGMGFHLNFPMWTYGFFALCSALPALLLLVIDAFRNKRKVLCSILFWLSVTCLIPVTAWWAGTAYRIVSSEMKYKANHRVERTGVPRTVHPSAHP